MSDRRQSPLVLLVAGIGLCAASVQVYATAGGVGATPDSRYYIEAARRLYGTGSLTTTAAGTPVPLIHFPPLLSILLAGAGFVSADPLDAARWLNSLLLFGTVGLSGLLIGRLSGGSRVLTIAGALLVAGQHSVFMLYLWAWSEPLFICLLLAGFIFLADYAQGQKVWLLTLAGAFIGLAWVTRYVGGIFAVSIAVWLLLQPGPFRARIGPVTAFLAPSALPIGLWTIRNYLLVGRPTDRTLAFHPLRVSQGVAMLSTGFFVALVGLGAVALVALLLKADFRQAWQRIAAHSVINCLWLSLLVYLAGLALSISLFDAATPLDSRILSPALVLLIIAAFSTLAYVGVPPKASWPFRLSCLALYSLFLFSGLSRVVAESIRSHRDGGYFTGRMWRESPTIAYVRALPASEPIYSNGDDVIYLLTGRSTHRLPQKADNNSQIIATTYRQEADAMRQNMVQDGGVVVYFWNINRDYLPSPDEVAQFMPPLATLQLADGAVLSAKPSP